VDAVVADVPNAALDALAADSAVVGLHFDRPIVPMLSSGGAAGGRGLGVGRTNDFDGSGVGVAVIDSGITDWHDDLARATGRSGLNGQRVSGFVDVVGGAAQPRDGYGHGTHVAGIIAGNGYDADGAYAGVAPGAQLLVLKVLDDQGRGTVSDVIRAIDFAVANRARFNLRIINLSIGAAVLESYETDPLALAARHAVESGLVVVAAAGNFGKNADGEIQYGGITAPGNSPWVLTVGAYSTFGTPDPSDDRVAGYSSRGPTADDFDAKPYILAPGTRIVSLNERDSYLSSSYPA
jgi:serine protease AprX